MTTNDEQQFIQDVLADAGTTEVIKELGIGDASEDEQAEMLAALGETIMARLVVEILKALPSSEHDAFNAFIGTGDVLGMRAFLAKHIPDVDAFLQHEVTKEYEATKTALREAEQGV